MQHRDLKAANVLLVADGDGLVAKICDFGSAKWRLALANTSTGDKGSTAAWAAPETYRSRNSPGVFTEASDVWSFGMLLFEMVTGWPPFRALGMPELLKCLIARARPPMPPSIPSPVADLIAECCADEAADRPTARALLAKLCALEKQLAREGPAWPAAPAGVRDVTLSPPSVSIATGLPVPQPRAPAPSRAPFSLAAFSASAPGAL